MEPTTESRNERLTKLIDQIVEPLSEDRKVRATAFGGDTIIVSFEAGATISFNIRRKDVTTIIALLTQSLDTANKLSPLEEDQ